MTGNFVVVGDCGVKSDPATGKEGDIYKIQEGLADLGETVVVPATVLLQT